MPVPVFSSDLIDTLTLPCAAPRRAVLCCTPPRLTPLLCAALFSSLCLRFYHTTLFIFLLLFLYYFPFTSYAWIWIVFFLGVSDHDHF
jgi:hypothetical protein